MGTWTGFGGRKDTSEESEGTPKRDRKIPGGNDDDDMRIRFTIGGAGRRLTKDDFLKEMRALDPKARVQVLEESDAPAAMKDLARKDASQHNEGSSRLFGAESAQIASSNKGANMVGAKMARNRGADVDSDSSMSEGEDGEERQDSPSTSPRRRPNQRHEDSYGFGSHEAEDNARLTKIDSPSNQEPETAAERKRREQVLSGVESSSGPYSIKPEQRETPADRRRREASGGNSGVLPKLMRGISEDEDEDVFPGETPAEKRRREAALGVKGAGPNRDDDSDDDNTERVVPTPAARARGIRFAEEPVRVKK